jgi:hypothetical protein
MGEVEVFQIHIENVIVIGYFNVVFVALAVRPRFGAVAYLDFDEDDEDEEELETEQEDEEV